MKFRTLRHQLLMSLVVVGVLVTGPSTAAAAPKDEPPNGPWMDKTLSPDKRADLGIEQMTLDEKIGMVHGTGWTDRQPAHPRSNGGAGFVPGVPRLGIPDIQMADSATG